MSRQPRAGTAGKPVTMRVSDPERRAWEKCATDYKKSLSDWLRDLANTEVKEYALRMVMWKTGVSRAEAEVAYADGKRLAAELIKASKKPRPATMRARKATP